MIATWFRGAAVGALLVLGACLAGPASAAEPADLQAEVRLAVETYIAAVMSNDPAKLAPLLAPEFQILRADGTNYDAKSYPASSLPIIAEMPVIERLNVTANGDIAVASFYVNINQTRDGVVVQGYAPRITVFRRDGGKWLAVAWGNFAPLER